MTRMLVLSGRVELMVMRGGVKNNYEHNVVVMNLPLCRQTAEFKFRSLKCLITKQAFIYVSLFHTFTGFGENSRNCLNHQLKSFKFNH